MRLSHKPIDQDDNKSGIMKLEELRERIEELITGWKSCV